MKKLYQKSCDLDRKIKTLEVGYGRRTNILHIQQLLLSTMLQSNNSNELLLSAMLQNTFTCQHPSSAAFREN